MLDACLVTLMEHGFTPAALVTRIIAASVPDQVQVAIAAWLLTVGSVFMGTIEGYAAPLEAGMASGGPAADCTRIADEYIGIRRPIPGFGHPCHTPDDPRTPALFAVAAEARLPGHHVALLRQMSATVDARASKHLTIKATGTIGALLQEIGVPQSNMRAVAVISRCGGLARHIMKERQTESTRTIWKLTEDNIPYVPS